jgi:hypothetical protein
LRARHVRGRASRHRARNRECRNPSRRPCPSTRTQLMMPNPRARQTGQSAGDVCCRGERRVSSGSGGMFERPELGGGATHGEPGTSAIPHAPAHPTPLRTRSAISASTRQPEHLAVSGPEVSFPLAERSMVPGRDAHAPVLVRRQGGRELAPGVRLVSLPRLNSARQAQPVDHRAVRRRRRSHDHGHEANFGLFRIAPFSPKPIQPVPEQTQSQLPARAKLLLPFAGPLELRHDRVQCARPRPRTARAFGSTKESPAEQMTRASQCIAEGENLDPIGTDNLNLPAGCSSAHRTSSGPCAARRRRWGARRRWSPPRPSSSTGRRRTPAMSPGSAPWPRRARPR